MMPSWTAITQLHTARLRDAMPISTVRRADGKTIGVLPSVADEPHGPPNVEILRIGPSPRLLCRGHPAARFCLPLSGLTHMVPDPEVMERLHGRIVRFFRTHLGEPR
jgi:hypothetical protein